jgi:pimeloyl-ACP methyl ester carboxylesterase
MNLIDRGHGAPVVLIPGIQGRWEWMKPTVEALAAHCRVLTFSLADEPTAAAGIDAGRPVDGEVFDAYVDQVRQALDQAGVERAAICGMSYGGLIAAAFAARHPERVTALVLASALPPSWRLNDRARFYLRAPRLLAPVFCVASLRLFREIAAATGGYWSGMSVAVRMGARAVRHPFHPARMARRASVASSASDPGLDGVRVPVLVVTGEEALDQVVPPRLTMEYLRRWPHARHAILLRTGHLGVVTRAREFAGLVAPFAQQAAAAARTSAQRRHVG